MADENELQAAEDYAGKLAKLEPNDKSAKALFRYYRDLGDETQDRVLAPEGA